MTNHADVPSEAEPTSIADLAADAADVRRLLHLGSRRIELPDRRVVVVSAGVIPAGALALVAGLDSYGD